MSLTDERLYIPEDFFCEETRDGFLITEMMKRSWAAQIHLLKILEEFFDKYDIKYYATWGTLLGAVRHGGYIPWDDDIDINISRKDFWKLIEHEDELPHDVWILSIYSSDDFYNFHAVAKNNVKGSNDIFDDKREREFCGFPFIAEIDIYILDNIPDDQNELIAQKKLHEFGYSLVHRYVELQKRADTGMPASDEEVDLFLEHMEIWLEEVKSVYGDIFTIEEDRPLLNELCRLTDGIAALYCDTDCKRVSSFTESPGGGIENWGKDISIFEYVVRMPYEYTDICVPSGYEAELSIFFGTDYMTPRRYGGAHEYPTYKRTAKVLGFNIEYSELQYYAKVPDFSVAQRICDWGGDVVIVAFSIESIISCGGSRLDELEKLLEKLTSVDKSKDVLVCWYAFGFLDRENSLWRSIPHTMKRYDIIRDKYMRAENVINALLYDVGKIVGRSSKIYGEGSIIEAYTKKENIF